MPTPPLASQMDPQQVLRYAFDDDLRALRISGGKLVPEAFTSLTLAYTGADLTSVQYFNSIELIATITLSYTLGKLTGVVRS